MPIFKTFSQDLNLLEQHLTKDIISQTDCKTILTKLRTTFKNAFNSEFKERMLKYTRFDAQSFKDEMIYNMDSIWKYMLKIILHQQWTSQLLKQNKLMHTQEDHSNPIPALNVDSLKVDSVVIQNTCSEKKDSNSETASNKSVKESSLDSATKDVHAIKYKMSGNNTDTYDVNIGPIYNEEPMVEIPGRQIFTGHRFSPNKTSDVYEKTSPRSDLRWKPKGRIFKSISLRWIPTRKLFDSCTSKVDNEPPHESNLDISKIHKCKQTLDLSAGTSLNVPKEQSLNLSAEVPIADMISMTSMIELESLFGPSFDEYFNKENQVVSNSSVVTTADASDKCQQQLDSTSSTSTLATIVTAGGNFDRWQSAPASDY
nr:hypothetical protein [Tanacetum cinerariifolium]